MPKSQSTSSAPAEAGDASGTAAAAALDAVDAESDAKAMASGTVGGVDFSFKRKRVDSVQFRRLMQERRDIVALEYLFGLPKFNEILAAMADDDGETSEADYRTIWNAVNEAVGSGNS